MKTKRRRKFPYLLGLLIIILAGTASWALYSIINNGASDILNYFKIDNIYIQNFIIVAVVFVFLILFGYSFKKTIEKILK